MRAYCREMSRKLPDEMFECKSFQASKDLRIRYGLGYGLNNIVWYIMEDWFNSKMEDKPQVTVTDIPKRNGE